MPVRGNVASEKAPLSGVELEKCEETKRARDYLLQRIRTFSQALTELQDNCDHLRQDREAKSDTGNFDRSLDRYWWRCHCPDCGRVWDEDQ